MKKDLIKRMKISLYGHRWLFGGLATGLIIAVAGLMFLMLYSPGETQDRVAGTPSVQLAADSEKAMQNHEHGDAPTNGHEHHDHQGDSEGKVKEPTAQQPVGEDEHVHDEHMKNGEQARDINKEHDHEAKGSEKDDQHDDHEAGEAGHDEHGHAGEEGHSDKVTLTPDQVKEFGIELEQAQKGAITADIVRPAEVKFDENRVAHVVARVEGVVRSVMISQGDVVEEGAVMAIIDSRELADAKADFQAAGQRLQLAFRTFERETRLWKQKISSEKEYLEAKAAEAQARIARQAAIHKLHALGFNDAYIERLSSSLEDKHLAEYRLVAPLSGTVIERHITRGERISTDRQAFLLANLDKLWVDITLYARDLIRVKKSMNVLIDPEDGKPEVPGRIAFVTPNVSEETRTGFARVLLDNVIERLRPGMFIKAEIAVSAATASVRVPKSAIQTLEKNSVVFVAKDGAFMPRPIRLGRENMQYAEVVAGLQPGETFVSRGSFILKSQLSKESFGDGHAH